MSIAEPQVVIVDYKLPKQLKPIRFLQYDTNIIKFVVEDNAEAADLSNITNIVVNLRRPDEKVISQVLTADGNEIIYRLTSSEMLKIGVCEVALHLYDDEDRVTIAKFKILIDDNIEIGDAPTVEDVSLVQLLIESVNERLVELDEFDNQLTAVQNGLNNRATILETDRLSSVKADKTYVDSIVSNLSSGGPRDVFYSIDALESAFPNGEIGTYLVFDATLTDGAHSFIWSDGTWVDIGIYQGLGIADNSISPDKTTFINNTIDYDLEVGTLHLGLESVRLDRARTQGFINSDNKNGLTIKCNNANFIFSVVTYNLDGTWDGINRDWLNTLSFNVPSNKKVRFNLKKRDETVISASDLISARQSIVVYDNAYKALDERDFDIYKEITDNTIEEVLSSINFSSEISTEDFELGTISSGNNVINLTRIRLIEKIQVKKDNVIEFLKNTSNYSYGVSMYNVDEQWNGVDYGWLSSPTFTIPHDGFIRLVVRHNDNRAVTNISELALGAFDLKKYSSVKNHVLEIEDGLSEIKKITKKQNAVSSISVEYGRKNGASFVFARIPKVINDGSVIKPKVRVTSTDGSLTTTKRSTLQYARDNDAVFALNAGLFNVTSMTPEGQLIIDGVSLQNTPMTSDNGVPISATECYPLGIKSDGTLKAYYRNVTTSEMISDGVVHAVTAWGKLVDNFVPAQADIDAEIVHGGSKKYIRQAIGQYQNGDYCVCTVDMTRGATVNEAGLTYNELAEIFLERGVKFAFNLDGGGSAQTVIGNRQLNPIYEGTTGRRVPTVITFEVE